ncbi:hypothetical protein E8E14_013313 [Neopestalotiopsis sp. 37M]|nr:hypothetical protein E8E14_013313 [Neopestalotiopsis sp. 37M]
MFSRRNLKFLVIIPVVIAILGLTDLVMALPIGTEVSVADSTTLVNLDASAHDSAVSGHVNAAGKNPRVWPILPLPSSDHTKIIVSHVTTIKTSGIVARETNGDNQDWPWSGSSSTLQPTATGQGDKQNWPWSGSSTTVAPTATGQHNNQDWPWSGSSSSAASTATGQL